MLRPFLFLCFGLAGSLGLIADTASSACEASLPCTCTDDRYNQYIHCRGVGLTAVPTFHNSSGVHRDMHLDLSYNAITTVKPYAFKNLNHSHLNGFILHMENNKIADIEADAFMGYERSLTELYLPNNMLTSIPSALGNLTNLRVLDIRNNSIKTFDPHTMNQLGKVLTTLSFGDAAMTTWPSEFRFLRALQTLNIYYATLSALPQDAFHGFSQALQTLRIDSTTIGLLIPALCHLSQVRTFYYDNSNYYHGYQSIFEPCPTALNSLQTLHLSNDDLQHFPPVFVLFPNITSLYIINNPAMFYVDDSLVSANTKVQNLYIYGNGLTRVPEAVQKMPLLQKLDLHGNQIKLVETHDVADMDSLQNLRLDGNPIRYVSSMAFQNLPQLHRLYLNGTNIISFPQAIASMADLTDLYLPDDQIECNCDIAFLKNWHVRAHIRGTCESSTEHIGDFVKSGLRSCPSP